jgi:hypothetical protein
LIKLGLSGESLVMELLGNVLLLSSCDDYLAFHNCFDEPCFVAQGLTLFLQSCKHILLSLNVQLSPQCEPLDHDCLFIIISADLALMVKENVVSSSET